MLSEMVGKPKKKVSAHKKPRQGHPIEELEEGKHIRHDLNTSPSTEQSNVVPGSLASLLEPTQYLKTRDIPVQWTGSHP